MWQKDIRINARLVLWVLLAVIALLAILGVLAAVLEHSESLDGAIPLDNTIKNQFLLDLEANVPTWFSSVLLLTSGLFAAVMAYVEAGGRSKRWYWIALALLFVLLSADETASGHETVNSTMRADLDLSGIFYFAWVIFGLIAVILLTLLYARFVFSLPNRVRNLVILAAAIYLAGAIGVEMLGGIWVTNNGEANLTYGFITSVEELLEMIGLAVFIYALVTLLELMGPWTLRRPEAEVS